MYRKFGSVNYFRQMPPAQRSEFYRSSRDMKPDDIEKLASAEVFSKKEKTMEYHQGGKFLPVAVWRNKGFEIDEAEVHQDDKHFSKACCKK